MENIKDNIITVQSPYGDKLELSFNRDADLEKWQSIFKTILIWSTFDEDTVKELFDTIKLVQDKPYTIRVSSEGMIAFLDKEEVPLVIAGLYKMQTSLNLNND